MTWTSHFPDSRSAHMVECPFLILRLWSHASARLVSFSRKEGCVVTSMGNSTNAAKYCIILSSATLGVSLNQYLELGGIRVFRQHFEILGFPTIC